MNVVLGSGKAAMTKHTGDNMSIDAGVGHVLSNCVAQLINRKTMTVGHRSEPSSGERLAVPVAKHNTQWLVGAFCLREHGDSIVE